VKATVFVGTSLDGFIARVNGDLDFLPPGGGEPHGYDEFMATVDALVIGRNTFETVLKFDKWPYGGKPVFVLSTRTLAPAPAGAVVARLTGHPAEIVSQLAARGVRHIYVDGGITIQRFLQAGLIQRLIITRVPVLIGDGIPLFGTIEHDIMLRHVATLQYASGLVQSEYVVASDKFMKLTVSRAAQHLGVLMKPERNRSDPAERDSMRKLRLIGAIAAFLAVLGIVILVFWLMIRWPRF